MVKLVFEQLRQLMETIHIYIHTIQTSSWNLWNSNGSKEGKQIRRK